MSLVTGDITRKMQAAEASAGLVSQRRGKRVLDLCIAIPALAFLLPAFVAIIIALYFVDGRPIVFRHKRVGLNGKSFDCLKFRSMRRDAAKVLADLLANDPVRAEEWKETQKLKNDPRTHALGRLLRMTSFDELPQLINVVKGDMSIVGPRPIVAEEMERYGSCLPYYLSLKPGITGLWQVTRRADTTYDERIGLDVEYYNRCSLRTDLVIIWKTIGVVLFAQNEC